MKSRKGITLIGELIALIFLIATGYLLGGLIIFVKNVSQNLTGQVQFFLTIKTAFLPIKHEYTMLAFLESIYQTNSNKKIPIKTILTQAVTQNSVDKIYINGEFVDLKDASTKVLSVWPKGDKILLLNLKISGNNHPIFWDAKDLDQLRNRDRIRLQKVSLRIFSPQNEGVLEYIVG